MNKLDLNKQLVQACQLPTPDLEEINKLIIAGADTNQVDENGTNIFDDVFLFSLYNVYDNDGTDDEKTLAFEKVKKTIKTMIEYGWDSQKYGLQVLSQFTLSFYDSHVFDIFKFFMSFDLGNNKKSYEKLLESIGTEESYQRCCEECHQLENLFYAMYEMVEAKMNGKNHEGIELYNNAEGLTVDKIIYFDESNTMVNKEVFTEYNADIGFICGNKLLVLRNGVNILFMNDRIKEKPQIDISDRFTKNIIGQKIKSINFKHRNIIRDTTQYDQPIIVIEFDNGQKLVFTHNFGEMPDIKTQSRFFSE